MPKVSVNNINNVNSEKIQGDQGDQGEQSDQGEVRIYFEKITLHFILYLHSGSAFFADMTHAPVVQVSWRNTVIRLKECGLHAHQGHKWITKIKFIESVRSASTGCDMTEANDFQWKMPVDTSLSLGPIKILSQ